MKVVKVVGDRLVERRYLCIDQQVMMAGIWFVYTCRGHTHIDEAEANCRLLGKHRPVVQADKVDPGVSRRLLARGRVNDTDPDERRHDWGRVRNVVFVPHEQLQGVRARL